MKSLLPGASTCKGHSKCIYFKALAELSLQGFFPSGPRFDLENAYSQDVAAAHLPPPLVVRKVARYFEVPLRAQIRMQKHESAIWRELSHRVSEECGPANDTLMNKHGSLLESLPFKLQQSTFGWMQRPVLRLSVR